MAPGKRRIAEKAHRRAVAKPTWLQNRASAVFLMQLLVGAFPSELRTVLSQSMVRILL